MTSPRFFSIPKDIIDLIFEQIYQFPDDKERRRALAATALVSWYCRHRAHTSLFSDVYINNCADGDKLLRLIHVDRHSERTGMASYIRTLTVDLHGLEHTIRPVLDNGTLAAILRRVFRSQHARDCALTLAIRVWREDPVASDDFLPFDWESLRPDCTAAVYDLCRESNLVTLHLSYIDNIPRTVLHHSRIRHLKIAQVHLPRVRVRGRGRRRASVENDEAVLESLREYPNIEVSGAAVMVLERQGQAVFLESVNTDHSLPILELIDATPTKNLHPKLAFSRLVNLTSQITNNRDFCKTLWMMANAASTLTTLEVGLSSYNDMLAPSWDEREGDDSMDLSPDTPPALNTVAVLKSVFVNQQAPSFPTPLKSSIPPVYKVMNQIKLYPFIEDVKIAFDLFSEYHPATPLNIFQGHDLSPLDKLFGRGGFVNLRRLTIQLAYYFQVSDREVVDAERLRAEGELCVRAAFVESAKTVAGRIHVDIQIFPAK